ncbi:DsbA family protein [Candidatus Peribacteria bacterium]|nr:DsbA family protein [Candidatus Peribacteria bacterium]
MPRHFVLFTPLPFVLMNSTPSSSWTGFLMGLLAGTAVSSLFIGMVLGYTMSGGMLTGTIGGTVAGNVPNVPSAPDVPEAPAADPAPVTARDHVRGNAKAKITVIEYSDFECPFCKRHAPTIDGLLAKYKNDVNVVFRHFPLSFHQNAQKEAEASECVAELGGNDAFWKFHDAIFERSTVGGTGFALDKLAPLAKEFGVDEAKFTACLDSDKYAQYVTDQMNEGIKAGVQGTPGNFVINNDTKEVKNISGAVPASTFEGIIDGMLAGK